MTEIEKLEAEEQVIKERLAAARAKATEDSLRDSFGKLSQDDSLPVAKIVATAVGRPPLDNANLDAFAERLAHLTSINAAR